MPNYREPVRMFEDSGVVDPGVAYHVELENVVNTKNQNMKTMVDLGRYFSIFAPRQSGKTTYFESFCRKLERDPTYISILLSFEPYANIDGARFFDLVFRDISTQLEKRLADVQCPQLGEVRERLASHRVDDSISFYELFMDLNRIIRFKKIVIFIDEFDGIPRTELGNFLTVIRRLYQQYKRQKDKALSSVGLIGIRNITKLIVGGVSPFNIADQVTLPPFSLGNIQDLYSQYTEETNQPFEESAVKKVHEETAGQPWLVNRLGTIVTTKIKSGTTEPIAEKDVDGAVAILLKEKNLHFDNLLQKINLYRDTFIDIARNQVDYDPDDEDQSFLEQYGLIKEANGRAVAANPIYKKRFSKPPSSNNLLMSTLSKLEKKVFISYSRKDRRWLDLLLPHLGVLEYKGIECWYDEKIRPGEDWPPEIQHAIEISRVAVCLVSANFLNSRFIRNREVPELLKRRKMGLKILPVLAESCAWKHVPWLAEIQIKDQIPLSGSTQGDQEKKLAAIADHVAECFDEMEG